MLKLIVAIVYLTAMYYVIRVIIGENNVVSPKLYKLQKKSETTHKFLSLGNKKWDTSVGKIIYYVSVIIVLIPLILFLVFIL